MTNEAPVKSSEEPVVGFLAVLGHPAPEQPHTSPTLPPRVSREEPSPLENEKHNDPLETTPIGYSADTFEAEGDDAPLTDESQSTPLPSAVVMQPPAITTHDVNPHLNDTPPTGISRPTFVSILSPQPLTANGATPKPILNFTSDLFDTSTIKFGSPLAEKSFKLPSSMVIDFVPTTADLSGLKSQADPPQ